MSSSLGRWARALLAFLAALALVAMLLLPTMMPSHDEGREIEEGLGYLGGQGGLHGR